VLCNKCGKPNLDEATVCASCGAPLAQPAGVPPPPPDLRPARTSGMAIASLVLGILGMLGLTALLAVVLGIVALVQISRSGGRLRGQGLAIAGICLSAFMLVAILPAMLLFPVFSRARATARKTVCLTNVKQVSLGLLMYTSDWDETYPDSANWCEDLDEYVNDRGVLVCPEAPKQDCGYAYNASLSNAKIIGIDDPANTVGLFESDKGWNAAGDPAELLPIEPRHLGGDNFGYLDGHARWLPRHPAAEMMGDPPY